MGQQPRMFDLTAEPGTVSVAYPDSPLETVDAATAIKFGRALLAKGIEARDMERDREAGNDE